MHVALVRTPLVGLSVLVFAMATFACSTGGSDSASAQAAEVADEAEKVESSRPVVKTPVPTDHPAGPQAPAFRVAGLDGGVYTLDDFEGQVLMIDFWATWCGPCKMAIPHLVELQEELGDRGFSILGVSVDRKGPEYVKKFAERAGINYAMAMGNSEMSRAYGGPQGIRSIPTAFLVDRDGRVAKMIRGFQTKEALLRDIEPLLDRN